MDEELEREVDEELEREVDEELERWMTSTIISFSHHSERVHRRAR